jgi:predicted ATPase/DNA-binding SARP family transcriptional activator
VAPVPDGNSDVEVRLLGRVELLRDGEPVAIEGTRRKSLIAILALNPRRVVSADRLVDALWGDGQGSTSARSTDTGHNLRANVSNLRKALGAEARLVVSQAPGYLLDVDDDAVDVLRFERLATSGREALRRGDAAGAVAELGAALALWRGAPLAELVGLEFAEREADRLTQERLGVVEDRLEAELVLGHHHDVVAELEALVGEHPLRERFTAQLMLAQFRCGRQADALRAYEHTRVYLARELGIAPGRELRDLEGAILSQESGLDLVRTDAFTALANGKPAEPDATRDVDLPAETTDLVDRQELVDTLVELTRSERLVTLWGPGGVGKTRVAVHVARLVGDSFPDGVRFIDLTAVEPSSSVGDVVLSGLRVQVWTDESPDDAIARALRAANVLIVLDNCEHVLPGVRALVERVTAECPDVHLLATSRESLAVAAEQAVNVVPLDLPAESAPVGDLGDAAAVQLFVERATRVDASFVMGDDNAGSIATLVRALDGLPLAIELAAGRLDVESVADLAADASGTLLARLQARLPARERTASINASLAWTYDALPSDQQDLFCSLSTFAGPFTREMALAAHGAEETAGPAFDRLIRVSLVGRDLAVPARLRLLEPVKVFGRARQDPATRLSVQRRHAHVMLSRAERFGPLVRTREQVHACSVFRADLADHRTAMTLLLDGTTGDVDDAARLLIALFHFCHFQIVPEVDRWAWQLAEMLPDDHPLAAEVCAAAALGAWFEGRMDRAIQVGERSVQLAREHGQRAPHWARLALVDAYGFAGRTDELFQHFQALVRDSRDDLDPFWRVNGLGYEAIGALMVGRERDASRRAEDALRLARSLRNPECLQWALHCQGRVLVSSDPVAACSAFEEAMTFADSVDSRLGRALNLSEWVTAKRHSDAAAEAIGGLVELLGLLRATGIRSLLSTALREAAYLLHGLGDDEAATIALLARRDLPDMPVLQDDQSELRDQLRAAAGDGWSRLTMQARARSEDEVMDRCLSSLTTTR